MGARGAHVRDGGRLPAILRRPTHPDLREDRLRTGKTSEMSVAPPILMG